MKKLIALFLVATVLSCSNEDQNQNEASLAVTSGSVLDGKVLSFKNEESFVKEYSDLAALNKDELQSWISSKKLVSLMNAPADLSDMEGEVLSESRIIYSDALKSVLNNESKVKIAGKVLWLNERSFYLLSENEVDKKSEELLLIKDKLEVYGRLLSVSESGKGLTSRYVLPNENRIKTFATAEINVSGSRLRHVIDLYNETIILNDAIQTSKMFVRSILQYRSCSTIGGCKWKEAMNSRMIASNFCTSCAPLAWDSLSNFGTTSGVSGTQTYLIANWRFIGTPYAPSAWYPNFVVSGPVTCNVIGTTGSFSTDLSWY